MKAIYIDKEGAIKFGEFPEYPTTYIPENDDEAITAQYESIHELPQSKSKEWKQYEEAIQQAKDNAIPIQNKEYATDLVLYKLYLDMTHPRCQPFDLFITQYRTFANSFRPYIKPDTIYPYNGEYEIYWSQIEGKFVFLKEPVKQDSEAEELFRQVIEIFNREHKRLGRPDYTELKAKFTITSK